MSTALRTRLAPFFLFFLVLALLTVSLTVSLTCGAPPVSATRTAPAASATIGYYVTPYALNDWLDAAGPFAGCDPATYDGPRDATGVRVVLVNGVQYDHPVAEAQDGLCALAHGNTDLAILEASRLVADHVISSWTGSSGASGAWWYPYRYDYAEYGNPDLTADALWYSGMAEGEALLLFTQLYEQTNDPQWLTAASHTFWAFLYPLQDGENYWHRPYVTRVDDQNYFWSEEWPKPNVNDDAVNGLGFATYGLIAYARLTNEATKIRLVGQACLTTYLYAATSARNPGDIASYSLSQRWDHNPKYHLIVTHQLQEFAQVTGARSFASLAANYAADYHG